MIPNLQIIRNMSKTNFCVKIVYNYYCFNTVIIVFIIQLFFSRSRVFLLEAVAYPLVLCSLSLCYFSLSYKTMFSVFIIYGVVYGTCFLFTVAGTLPPLPVHAANKSSREMVWILFSLWHCRPPQVYWFLSVPDVPLAGIILAQWKMW